MEILAHLVFMQINKLQTGEGGMISTNNKNINEKCKSLKNLCFGTGKIDLIMMILVGTIDYLIFKQH